ncbi:MAG TPA: hypothetical protein VFU50_07330 [Terriglobales bacterium]|nr:hypothetical protein [Terriglobales bacterium]
MEISVDGFRGDAASRDAVRGISASQLPKLTEAQRDVARKLGSSEEEYARMLLAGEKNQEKLLRKTERVARLIRQMLQRISAIAEVKSVALRVFQERFDVAIAIGTEDVALSLDERLIDSYFDEGSSEAEASLNRVLERALAVRA